MKHILRLSSVHRERLAGFTMVEVVIVLLVLGILAILILNSLQTVQAKSRDSTRRNHIDQIAQKLETCYDDKDKCGSAYPSLLQLTDTSPNGFVVTNLPGFNNDWLKDSSNGVIQGNDATAATQYQYSTSPDDCTGTTGSTKCTGFTLRAYQETNPDHPYVKDSFNK
jgi:prepilin-type N-terminal cleavage/methylation domain-containing protein